LRIHIQKNICGDGGGGDGSGNGVVSLNIVIDSFSGGSGGGCRRSSGVSVTSISNKGSSMNSVLVFVHA